MAAKSPRTKTPKQAPRNNRQPVIVGGSGLRPSLGEDIKNFVDLWKTERFYEIVSMAQPDAKKPGKFNAKKANDKAKKVALKVPASAMKGNGQNSERSLMQAFGLYWEPLLHDLAFYEEMRDSVAIIDGEIQKLVDVAMTGFALQSGENGDPDTQTDLEKALLKNPNVNFREVVRSAMVDLFSLGNCYKVPIWTRDDEDRLVPKNFRPVRANALRKLRDEDLMTIGYVQLLHRPSEFIMGTPAIPTFYMADEMLCGIMRTFGWYAYGKPLFASLPFVVRLKLTMERDLAEMLHQHVPRIDITYTPEDQMSDEQVKNNTASVKAEVAAMRPTDNFVHTPDTQIEYKGPEGKGVDFKGPQQHIEEQLFYVLPFAKSIMGLDSQSNPFDSQQRWKLSNAIACYVREAVEQMFAPALDKMADDWGIDDGIKMGWTELDPEQQQQLATADEYHANNAIAKRDAGFIDQDTAAHQATLHQKGGPVKKAAAPGQIPPPTDPNKIDPATGKPFPPAATPGGGTPAKKVSNKDKGPRPGRSPQGDKRTKGRRHDAWLEVRDAALSRFSA